MSAPSSGACVRCGAMARTTPHVIRFDTFSQWDGALCPRHYSQIMDFLELALAGWDKMSTGEVVPVVTNLDLPVRKKRGRPRKEPAAATVKEAVPARKEDKTPPEKSPAVVAAPSGVGDVDFGAVREWARANNVDVSKRGRISASVIEQWRAENMGGSVQPVASRSLRSARNKSAASRKMKPSVLFSAAEQ